jgi:putative phosphoserine phosphatase/1-acylglycerol-3-phosphate O-acyltransferase
MSRRKGDFVFRPATVEVDVLPPVDTSDWSPETIDEHVREVRNMFLRTLGQPEEPAPSAGEACTAQGQRAQKKRHAPLKKKTTGTAKQGDEAGSAATTARKSRRLATESPPRMQRPGSAKTVPGRRPGPRQGQNPPRGDPAAGPAAQEDK